MSEEPSILDKLSVRPAYCDDPLMVGAFLACCEATMNQDGAVEAFRADTGIQWAPGRSLLDRMIDDATGAGDDFCIKFMEWVARTVWGLDGEEAAV